MEKNNLSAMRKEFLKTELNMKNIHSNPFEQFSEWFSQAVQIDDLEANTMFLATSTVYGIPSLRAVLLKEFDRKGFTFYTNYNSRKGNELKENPNAALLFYWKELERQVRIEGVISFTDVQSSLKYFNSRPFESRIAAVVSEQSKVISDREILDKNFSDLKKKYENGNVPKPENWGGYTLMPERFEFWQGRENRLHDRILFSKSGNEWSKARLSP